MKQSNSIDLHGRYYDDVDLSLEKHFKIGGYTHTFKRQGYEWDVGIHYIGGVHKKNSFSRKLFDKITENNLKWNKTDDNYDRITFPDKSYDFIAPKSKFIEQIKSYFPEEESNIDKYIDVVLSIKNPNRFDFAVNNLRVDFLHDSIVVDGHPDEIELMTDILDRATKNVIDSLYSFYKVEFNVPLDTELKIGDNWLDMNEVSLKKERVVM